MATFTTRPDDSAFPQDDRAVDFFGEQLQKTGYSYHGNESMYSGISGEEMQATIFVGLVYYQRLRHMVCPRLRCTDYTPCA